MQLLHLRYLQLKRDLGVWTVLIAIAAFFSSRAISDTSALYCWVFAGAVSFLLYNYHSARRDLGFIENYLGRPRLQIAINYNLLMLPVSAGMLVNGYWLQAVALHSLATGIVFTRIKQVSFTLSFISRMIPAQHFEWIAGIRTHFISIALLLLLAVFLSPVKLFGVAALFLLNSIFLGFFNYFEPLCMLNPSHLPAAEFLNRKVAFFSRIILTINLPLLVVNTAFHPEIAWFNLCFLIGFQLFAACVVHIKYANYRPNEQLGLHADQLVLFAALFIPYLLPICIFIYFSSRKKALHHLSHYCS